jgi:hypothetical protein
MIRRRLHVALKLLRRRIGTRMRLAAVTGA